jgi:hypothetical protein
MVGQRPGIDPVFVRWNLTPPAHALAMVEDDAKGDAKEPGTQRAGGIVGVQPIEDILEGLLDEILEILTEDPEASQAVPNIGEMAGVDLSEGGTGQAGRGG